MIGQLHHFDSNIPVQVTYTISQLKTQQNTMLGDISSDLYIKLKVFVFRVPFSVFRPEQYLRNRYTDFETVKSKVDLLHE